MLLFFSDKMCEVYFTSDPSPQHLRLHMLNSQAGQRVIFSIYYPQPQRFDVYVGGYLVNPTNYLPAPSGGSSGLKPPTYPTEWLPVLNNTQHGTGTNYADAKTYMVWVLIDGPQTVNIFQRPVIFVSFSMPALTEAEFFDDANIVNNLAQFLGIPKSRIKVVNIVNANTGSSRRRRANDEVTIDIEISPEPSGVVLDMAALEKSQEELSISAAQIITAVQTGQISEAINQTVLSTGIVTPIPPPDSPTWGQEMKDKVVIRIPHHLDIVADGVSQSEGIPFSEAISFLMFDSSVRVYFLYNKTVIIFDIEVINIGLSSLL